MFIKRGFSLGDKVKSLVSIEPIEGTFTENHVFTIDEIIDEVEENKPIRFVCEYHEDRPHNTKE
mgnify:FL=1